MNIKKRKTFLPVATAVFDREEEKNVIETLRSGWITLGPKTKEFERLLTEYTGAKYAIALNSCSAALHLAMIVSGIKKGDEVITSPFTFAATANAIMHCGGRPVFADIDLKTFNIDPNNIEDLITPRTKALLPVDYGGQPADFNKISKIANNHNLLLIEDAAHSIGAQYFSKKIGTIADMTCFSFHPVKNMTSGDGGAIVTNNKEFADKLGALRVNGMEKESWKRNTQNGSWDYAVIEEGYKYHMNDIAAAIAIPQINKLDKFTEMRKKIADWYDRELGGIDGIEIPSRASNIKHAHNIYGILINIVKIKISRNEVMEILKAYNIGTVVYFRPLSLQPLYQKKYNYKTGNFPNSEYVFERLICLPIYPMMSELDVIYVSNVLKSILSDNRR